MIPYLYFCSLLHEYAQFGYFPTYHHVAPYCLGTFIGYLILRHQKTPFVISRWTQFLIWILAPVASLFVLFCTKGWNTFDDHVTPSVTVSVLYSMFQRVLWSLGIAWISFVCATGYGGIVNNILSCKLFIPFSRLSYSIYMVHLIPIFLRVNSMRYTRAWDDFEFVSWGVFNIVLGIFGAYLLYVFFESPINGLEKLLFRPDAKTNGNTKKSQDNDNNNDKPCSTSRDFEQQSIHEPKQPSDICTKHAIETINNEHHPPITSFAAYKIRSSSISSGFSEVSVYSLDHHQRYNHRNISRRQRV